MFTYVRILEPHAQITQLTAILGVRNAKIGRIFTLRQSSNSFCEEDSTRTVGSHKFRAYSKCSMPSSS